MKTQEESPQQPLPEAHITNPSLPPTPEVDLPLPEPNITSQADETWLLNHLQSSARVMLTTLEQDCLGTHNAGICWLLYQATRSLRSLRTNYGDDFDEFAGRCLEEFEPYFQMLNDEYTSLKRAARIAEAIEILKAGEMDPRAKSKLSFLLTNKS